MKHNMSCQVLMLLCAFTIFCALLSCTKAQVLGVYHQDDYDVKMERCMIAQFNHSFYKHIKADLVPFNRTHRAINATADLIVDLSSNIKLDVQFYKFMSNEYRFFPITVSVNACSELHRNTFQSRTIFQEASNMPESPWKKGHYHLRNGAPKFAILPPYIPRGAYKVEAKLYDNLNFMFQFDGYGSVTDKPVKW